MVETCTKNSSQIFQYLQMRPQCRLKIPGTDYPVTKHQFPEAKRHQHTNNKFNTPNHTTDSVLNWLQVTCWNIHWAVGRDDSEHPTIGVFLYSAEDIAAGACCGTEGNLIEMKLSWATSHLIWWNAKQTDVYWVTSISHHRETNDKD
jgi:hypothetical protein